MNILNSENLCRDDRAACFTQLFNLEVLFIMEWNWQEVVSAIKTVVNTIKKDYLIENDVLRDYVFEILEKECIVLYYPIEEEKNNGFHIKKIVNNELEDFVYINTAKPVELQVFTAAHEMGHVWNVAKKVWDALGYTGKIELEKNLEEDITNRFAAELLMPENTFVRVFNQKKMEMGLQDNLISIDDLLRISVGLMNTFLVQYDAVRKRFYETGIITVEGRKRLKEKNDEYKQKVQVYAKEQNSLLEKASNNKTIPGIRELIEEAEEKQSMSKIALEKIKADFGIKQIEAEAEVLEILNANGDNHGEKTSISGL